MVYVEFIDITFPACTENDLVCFGTDIKTILDSLGNIYGVISSDDTHVEDIACLLAIAAMCKVVYFTSLIVNSRKTSKFDGSIEK